MPSVFSYLLNVFWVGKLPTRSYNNEDDGGKEAKPTNSTTNNSGAPVQFGFRYNAADQEMIEITTYIDDDVDGGKGHRLLEHDIHSFIYVPCLCPYFFHLIGFG